MDGQKKKMDGWKDKNMKKIDGWLDGWLDGWIKKI